MVDGRPRLRGRHPRRDAMCSNNGAHGAIEERHRPTFLEVDRFDCGVKCVTR